MLRTLIEIEKERLAAKGFGAVVSVDEISIFDKNQTIQLGNDVAILTGFTFDMDAVAGGENQRISVSSPTDAVCGTVDQLSALGVNIHKVMRQYMSVSRLGSGSDDVSPTTIHFVRISPTKQRR